MKQLVGNGVLNSFCESIMDINTAIESLGQSDIKNRYVITMASLETLPTLGFSN